VLSLPDLIRRLDLATGTIEGCPTIERTLRDLRGVFADSRAYESSLQEGNPVIYRVSTMQPGAGPGELHCGLGVLMPGRVGNEYFMTRGHLHSWRPAAEFYIGLKGHGIMLLEDESGRASVWCNLLPESLVHVPGATAHRTVNTGDEPLVYLGVYPSDAGHDYGTLVTRNFRLVVVAGPRGPEVISRRDFLAHQHP
jgi:glucose-6-phosphate isomerase